ncbi:unnamed protein product [Anisakis simplex]|uniref:DM5 domain-containing protein n=1 Tax=Anisakis simplex TaxID=6269 RepID=A0A0M3JTV8_ANISI|nr:unnamed protein product [Anisakis simplex]
MRGEVREDLKEAEQLAAEGLSVEKQQEQLLMNKLAANGRLPAKPQSTFLQKKLQQQRVGRTLVVVDLNENFFKKFFDSGDYAMNKDKAKHPLPSAVPNVVSSIASVQPTTHRGQVTALNVDVTTTSATSSSSSAAIQTAVLNSATPDESLQIPRPDTVPQRKASIIYPSVHSKLSPQPHIHHSSHDDILPDHKQM